MTLASVERNLDDDGTIHEGAVLTLIDSAGATVPWTLHQPDTIGATVALHAQILGRLPACPPARRPAHRPSASLRLLRPGLVVRRQRRRPRREPANWTKPSRRQ
jgi:hypothetical protein